MIGGNINMWIEWLEGHNRNEIGESTPVWTRRRRLTGWLDLMHHGTGPAYMTYSAPIAESTHVFLTDYEPAVAADANKTCQAVIEGQLYDVLLIDDPMGMHRHLEIYLKRTSGQGVK